MHYNDVVLNLDQIHDQISPFGLQHLYGPTKSDMLKWKNLNLIFNLDEDTLSVLHDTKMTHWAEYSFLRLRIKGGRKIWLVKFVISLIDLKSI